MANKPKRKKAVKRLAKKAKRTRGAKPRRKVRAAKTKMKAKRLQKGLVETSIDAVVDTIRETPALRSKLAGHNTFED